MANDYNTYVAYRDNNAYTSERGAGKFLDSILSVGTIGKGDYGAIVNGMEVNPGSAGMTVTITANDGGNNPDAHCIVKYNDYSLFCWQEADYTLQLAGASQSLDRISYIVAYVDMEESYLESENVVESPGCLKFVEILGTESASPVAPTRAQIRDIVGNTNPYIILASVSVPANTSTITASLITDLRIFTSLAGNLQSAGNTYTAGVYQTDNSTRTRFVVTDASASTPAAISGVEIIWIKKKA